MIVLIVTAAASGLLVRVLLHVLLARLPLLGASVLEPDLNLALAETELRRQLRFSPYCDVAAEAELLLQFETLVVGVHYSVLVFRAGFAWTATERE